MKFKVGDEVKYIDTMGDHSDLVGVFLITGKYSKDGRTGVRISRDGQPQGWEIEDRLRKFTKLEKALK